MGNRRKRICQVRAQMIYQLIEILGISLLEVAGQVIVSTKRRHLNRTRGRCWLPWVGWDKERGKT
jgi:hypothetical protein